MALLSPGVEVTVIDESFYTPAEPGTVPMIFVASASNKANASNTGIARGTLSENAGRPFLITSQRDLVETFGTPLFQVDSNNNPVHGSELNEYGLQSAYSYLGVSNRAWVVRADVDVASLVPRATVPTDNPDDGTYWLDTANTAWGIFEWDGADRRQGGQSFSVVDPIVITSMNQTTGSPSYVPKGSVGRIGAYAIVAVTTLTKLWYKSPGNFEENIDPGTWVEVGSAAWAASWPVAVGGIFDPALTDNNDFEISILDNAGNPSVTKTIVALPGQTVSNVATSINDEGLTGVTAQAGDNGLEIFSTQFTIRITEGSGLAQELGLLDEGDLPSIDFAAPALQISPHTDVPRFRSTEQARPTGSVWVKSTAPNAGARWRVKRFNGATQLFDDANAPIFENNRKALFSLDPQGGGQALALNTLYVKYNVSEGPPPLLANFKIFRRAAAGVTRIVSTANPVVTAGNITIRETRPGFDDYSQSVTVSVAGNDADSLADAINSAALQFVEASVDSSNRVIIQHTLGGDIEFVDSQTVLASAGFSAATTNLYPSPDGAANTWVASNWERLIYEANPDAPRTLAEDGAIWYNSIVDEVDIMINTGLQWVGYKHALSPVSGTDPNGPIVSATQPTSQSDGSVLVDGDLWVSTADIENYPLLYKFSNDLQRWVLVDNTDQTTDEGVLFADARWSTQGGPKDGPYPAASIADLLESDFVDFDAPDPRLYPRGMLLWNLRRSGFNVKQFRRNYVDQTSDNVRFGDQSMEQYYPHRWVTLSGNQEDGAGNFGRKAQRKVVIQALQAVVNDNDAVRDNESRIFNLLATPGYPELIGEMISLNFDRGLDAFIVGDSPARLTPDATSLNDWGNNVNLAFEDDDTGLVSRDEYLGVFYPWGFTSDNFGNNVVVPPSHMMLRTIALSDQVSYPWFAPAGLRRGNITNATSTGFINSEGEFETVALNEGQRDTLYSFNVNPITFITGSGLVAYGQKTRAPGPSALDRINVARLVIFLRSQLGKLAKPYIFEPNDKVTRDQIKQAAESLLLELVGQRALFDFLVVCDETNNTPARIDRNELYLDIAIEPVKAVEFIYIPIRVFNTGQIAGNN